MLALLLVVLLFLLVLSSLTCSVLWILMLVTFRKTRPLFGQTFETYLYCSFGFAVLAIGLSWLNNDAALLSG